MFIKYEETFTNDLRFRNEIYSIDNEEVCAIPEREVEPETGFSVEEVEKVWKTLNKICSKNSHKYIITYLVFYLGYSYRDAANVLGITVAWSYDLTQKAIEQLKKELVHESKTE